MFDPQKVHILQYFPKLLTSKNTFNLSSDYSSEDTSDEAIAHLASDDMRPFFSSPHLPREQKIAYKSE